MTKEEILRYVATSRDHEVIVDVSWVPEPVGMVRTVRIPAGNRVIVEFNSWNSDGGEYQFSAAFESVDQAIAALADYLKRPIEDWTNFTRSGEYPEFRTMDRARCVPLPALFASGRLELPRGTTWTAPE